MKQIIIDQEKFFETQVENTLEKIKVLLIKKGKEYRRNNDVYHNFNVGAKISGQTPEKVLQGFLLKHLISYQDILNDIEEEKLPSVQLVEEKFNDIITYFLIQKAQILNRIENEIYEQTKLKHTKF
jgi:hypothetical protein